MRSKRSKQLQIEKKPLKEIFYRLPSRSETNDPGFDSYRKARFKSTPLFKSDETTSATSRVDPDEDLS